MPIHALEKLQTRPTTHFDMASQGNNSLGEDAAAFVAFLKEMMKCNQGTRRGYAIVTIITHLVS